MKKCMFLLAGVLCAFMLTPSVGAQNLPSLGEVLALRHYSLKDGADTTAFEKLVVAELNPAWDKHVPGLHDVTMKGDRGARNGQYIGVWVFDTVERRDEYFPQEDTGWYPVFEEAYTPIQNITNKAGEYAGSTESYTDYVLVGAETMKAMPSYELLGIHKIKVKQDMEHDFEAFVARDWNTTANAPGVWILIYKGDRGADTGEYISVMAFAPGMRDTYFPASGASSAWQEASAPFEDQWNKMVSYLQESPESSWSWSYTDYVVIR